MYGCQDCQDEQLGFALPVIGGAISAVGKIGSFLGIGGEKPTGCSTGGGQGMTLSVIQSVLNGTAKIRARPSTLDELASNPDWRNQINELETLVAVAGSDPRLGHSSNPTLARQAFDCPSLVPQAQHALQEYRSAVAALGRSVGSGGVTYAGAGGGGGTLAAASGSFNLTTLALIGVGAFALSKLVRR